MFQEIGGPESDSTAEGTVGDPTLAGCVRARPEGRSVFSAWVGADTKFTSAVEPYVIQCLRDTGAGSDAECDESEAASACTAGSSERLG